MNDPWCLQHDRLGTIHRFKDGHDGETRCGGASSRPRLRHREEVRPLRSSVSTGQRNAQSARRSLNLDGPPHRQRHRRHCVDRFALAVNLANA